MKKHKQEEHNLFEEEPQIPTTDNRADDLYNYSKAHLTLGTLLLNADDAVKEGDGERLQKVFSVLTYVFKAMGNTKYAYACLRLSACKLALLSPRRYHQLIYNRFVNTKGKKGCCISRDLRLEHLNGVIKPIIKSIGYPNITSKVVEENSRALGAMEFIVNNTKRDVGHSKREGVHTSKHSLTIYDKVFKEVHETAENMQYRPGRQLRGYRGINPNIFHSLDSRKLYDWIKRHRDRWDSNNFNFYNFE